VVLHCDSGPASDSGFVVREKGKVHPCTGTETLTGPTARRGSRGIALHFLDHGIRMG